MKPLKKPKLTKLSFVLPLFIAFSIFALTNCNKGKVRIHGIIDTVQNCSLPYVVYFYPDAEYGNGDVEYTWDFGDGSSSHERTPVKIYKTTGLFQVTLTIKNKKAQESKSIALDLQSESIPIIPKYEWGFAGGGPWVPCPIFFTNLSEHATSYWWDFGDGYFTTDDHPEHLFTTAGEYLVRLGAICNEDTSTVSANITISLPPKDININEILVWLPDEYIGSNIYCEVFTDIHSEAESDVVTNITSFPVTLHVNEELFYFGGDYNNKILAFEIYADNNTSDPIYIFEITFSQIQNAYYPAMLGWDSANDYAAEVYLDYRN